PVGRGGAFANGQVPGFVALLRGPAPAGVGARPSRQAGGAFARRACAGLNATESQALRERLRRLAGLGLTLLVIEHDMTLVMGLCDRIGVLNFGNLIAEGTPGQISSNPQVIEAYLGGSD